MGCLLSERLLDPEICGTTGFVTSSPKDFNMKSAAVGNPQGASQGQTIDAPISVMFPALKRTLNRAKSTRPEFEVLVSKRRMDGCCNLLGKLFRCLILLLLGNRERERERRLFAKKLLGVDPESRLPSDPRCNIALSREWFRG